MEAFEFTMPTKKMQISGCSASLDQNRKCKPYYVKHISGFLPIRNANLWNTDRDLQNNSSFYKELVCCYLDVATTTGRLNWYRSGERLFLICKQYIKTFEFFSRPVELNCTYSNENKDFWYANYAKSFFLE